MTTPPLQPATEPQSPQALPPAAGSVTTDRRMPMGGALGWLNIVLGLALAIAIGGVAFAVGRMTAPELHRPIQLDGLHATVPGDHSGGAPFDRRPGGNAPRDRGYGGPGDGQGGRGFIGPGGATIQGTVTAITADKITITTAGGQTVDIALDGTTTYHLESSAASGDVKTGVTVIVRLALRQVDGTQTGPSAGDITIVP